MTVSVQRAARKEMIDVNNPKKELGRVPKAWRNADGSRILDVVEVNAKIA